MADAGDAERLKRLQPLFEAARLLADAHSAEGRALRAQLLETTGLSAPNIEAGLSSCLEVSPSRAELAELLESTPRAASAYVLLSSNVFAAPLRAIAIGLACAPKVFVRASRRDPALARALHALAPDAFELGTELAPTPGAHFWSYGADDTLVEVRAKLPSGVIWHPHGAGFGAVVVDGSRFDAAQARAIALDTALFDQQGCLSPRVVCSVGTPDQARAVAAALAKELGALEQRLPPGTATPERAAEDRRNFESARYAFEFWQAGSGFVSLDERIVVPPARRNLHVTPTLDPVLALQPFASHLTTLGLAPQLTQEPALRASFPGARFAELGQMQRPRLDGPVDRRHGTQGERIGS